MGCVSFRVLTVSQIKERRAISAIFTLVFWTPIISIQTPLVRIYFRNSSKRNQVKVYYFYDTT